MPKSENRKLTVEVILARKIPLSKARGSLFQKAAHGGKGSSQGPLLAFPLWPKGMVTSLISIIESYD